MRRASARPSPSCIPNIKIVGAQSAEGWKKEIAITIMNSFLQANKQLDGVFAVNDNMAEGAMIAAEAAGRLDQIKVWGANGQKSTLAFIEQGKIAGTAYNNSFAQGTLVADMMMEHLDKKLGPLEGHRDQHHPDSALRRHQGNRRPDQGRGSLVVVFRRQAEPPPAPRRNLPRGAR